MHFLLLISFTSSKRLQKKSQFIFTNSKVYITKSNIYFTWELINMDEKTYSIIRKIMVVIVGAGVAISILLENLIIAFAIIIFGMAILVGLKNKLKVKIEDERIYSIAQKASMRTVQIFGFIIATISILILIFRDQYHNFELIGSVLAYTACGFLLIYGVFYSYYYKKLSG